jgi:hypothetical protein
MRRIIALSLLAFSACLSAQPRVLPRGPAGLEGGLVSVAAGTYASGGGIVDLTYVADPATYLCFASTHVIQGGTTGPVGVFDVDCCAIRHVAEVAAALPGLASTCQATRAPTPTPSAAPPSLPTPPTPPGSNPAPVR